MNEHLLSDGLTIISACKKETGDIWQAHWGAAAIGSFFFIKNNRLDAETQRRISRQAEEMVRSVQSVRGQNRSAVMEKSTESGAALTILTALERSIDSLHWVGHNVIYSASCLSAIRELGGWGTREEIEGVADLIRSFEKTIPGRSWIGYKTSEVKRLKITQEDHVPTLGTPGDLSAFVLGELASFPVIYRAEAHHDLIGHMLTFSHALNVLHDLGHATFFQRGIVPLLQLVKALRASCSIHLGQPIQLLSAADRLPLHRAVRNEHLPIESEFWAKDYRMHNWEFGHVFKFPHSFYDHLSRIEVQRQAYTEAFRYLTL